MDSFRIAIIGDIHGYFKYLRKKLVELKEKYPDLKFCLQTGDTAFIQWPDEKHLKKLLSKSNIFDFFSNSLLNEHIDNIKESIAFSKEMFDLPIPVYFVGGNHEDWIYLSQIENENKPYEIRKNFYYLGRYGFIEIEGIKIMYLSGIEPNSKRIIVANPDDVSYSKKRYFFGVECKSLLEMTEKPDIFLSHDLPRYGEVGSTFIKVMVQLLKPRFSFHGHLHGFKIGRFISKTTITASLRPITRSLDESIIILKIRNRSIHIEGFPDDIYI